MAFVGQQKSTSEREEGSGGGRREVRKKVDEATSDEDVADEEPTSTLVQVGLPRLGTPGNSGQECTRIDAGHR
jgi:hypothetical protein